LINSTIAKELDSRERTLFGGVLKEIDAYEAMLAQVIQMATADASMAITMMPQSKTVFRISTANSRN